MNKFLFVLFIVGVMGFSYLVEHYVIGTFLGTGIKQDYEPILGTGIKQDYEPISLDVCERDLKQHSAIKANFVAVNNTLCRFEQVIHNETRRIDVSYTYPERKFISVRSQIIYPPQSIVYVTHNKLTGGSLTERLYFVKVFSNGSASSYCEANSGRLTGYENSHRVCTKAFCDADSLNGFSLTGEYIPEFGLGDSISSGDTTGLPYYKSWINSTGLFSYLIVKIVCS